MNILLVKPAPDFSVSDVAMGYKAGFEKLGHNVTIYDMGKRLIYHSRAFGFAGRPPGDEETVRDLCKQASETVIVEAFYCQAELVVIISGLVFHPLALQLLQVAKIRTAILHTESPYEDENQKEWDGANLDAHVFTHDRYSSRVQGWGFLGHAYNPAIHKPALEVEKDIDVFICGTGWKERVEFFEAIDWSGINFQIRGLWPIEPGTPLAPFYQAGCVENADVVGYYQRSKIALNLHRAHPNAESLNPRAFELAACGTFTLTDIRADGQKIFGDSQPSFETPEQLGRLVRHYLANPEGRQQLAEQARNRGKHETFDARAADMLAAIFGAS